jgi:hypothetical protein
MTGDFANWMGERLLTEAGSRYSIEVNFRTHWGEAKDHFVKLALGYVMAYLKQNGYHVKHVYTVKPYRILVSTKQWEDGEWVGIVSFNEKADKFVFTEGVYYKVRGTCSEVKSHWLEGKSAADIGRDVLGRMAELKKRDPRGGPKLNPGSLKRGPKK